jgi:hypothetical protein
VCSGTLLAKRVAAQSRKEDVVKTKIVVGSIVSMVSMGAASAEVFKDTVKVKGDAANASFYSETECSYTGASIWGGEQTTHQDGGQPQYTAQAYAYIYSFNWCTGESFDGYGSSASVNNDGTKSASISVPVNLYRWQCDEVSCEQITVGSGTFTASLTGSGDVFQGHSSSVWHGGGNLQQSRFNGKYRQATGNLSLIVNGVELLGPASYGELQVINAGTHTRVEY